MTEAAMPTPVGNASETDAEPTPRLACDLAVWLIILAELLAFAILFLAFVSVSVWRSQHVAQQVHAVETGAAFWHMVELLWIVLFPLVYIVR